MSGLTLPLQHEVRRSFERAATSYDEHAFLQREIAQRLFERLDYIKIAPTRVLELGCGTGYATQKLRARFATANLFALDLSAAMCGLARQRMPQVSRWAKVFRQAPLDGFICADAEQLPIADDSVELIVSNLTLQWCDPEKVAREAARVLKPGGLLMFTSLGPDTLKELRAAFKAVDDLPHVNQFVDMHDVGDILALAGLSDPVMDQELVTLTYRELMPMLRELKGIGAHNLLPGRARGLMGKSRWQQLQAAYEKFRTDGRLPATYEVVYGHAWKPLVSARKTVDGEQKIALNDFKRMLRA